MMSAVPERHSAEAAAVLAALARFRRRAVRVAALRNAIATILGVLIVAQLTAVGLGTLVPWTAPTVAAVLCLAAVAGGAVAVARAPSLIETAMIVDRRLHLENRATATLQFVRADDPVARLVVRDGAARLALCRPPEAFPVEYPRHVRMLVTGVACATLLFVAAQSRSPSSASRQAGASGIGAAQAGALARGEASGGPEESGGQAQQRAGLGRSGPERGAPDHRAGSIAPAVADSRAGSTGPPPAPSTGAAVETPTPSHGEKTPSPESTNGRAAAGGSVAGRTGDTRSAAAGPPIGASASGGSVTGEVTGRGGGLRGAAPRANAAARATSTAGPRQGVESAQSRADWQRGQAAIAQARIPPELRHYVRAYFAAIRSPQQP